MPAAVQAEMTAEVEVRIVILCKISTACRAAAATALSLPMAELLNS